MLGFDSLYSGRYTQKFCIRIFTVDIVRVGHFLFGEMECFVQWEYYVVISQRQNSFHILRPKETCFTDLLPVNG
jgi:hypothetical protein